MAPLSAPRPPWSPVAELAQYEAVQLFVERARQVVPDFELTHADGTLIAEICARLDGLPLAIELAAARVKLLTPSSLLNRLDRGLDVLVGVSRDRPARQQTIRATIDWSYHLLNPEQQAVFRKLSVFSGGCTLEAAEAVCTATDGLNRLAELVDQSLIRRDTDGEGEPRLRMLETIREYALEQLTIHDESIPARRAHMEYFTQLSGQADLELVAGAERSRWLRRLEMEEDNLRAAMRWCLEAGESQRGLRLGVSAVRYWVVQGTRNATREWRQDLTQLAAQVADPGLRGWALNGAGALALYQGDYVAAEILHQEALRVAREQNDPKLDWSAQHNLALLATRRGEYDLALNLFEQIRAIHHISGDRRRELVVLNMIAGVRARNAITPPHTRATPKVLRWRATSATKRPWLTRCHVKVSFYFSRTK